MQNRPEKTDDDPERGCEICGAPRRTDCRGLDKLGTRSLEADHTEVCPVCGSDYTLLVWIRGHKMCGLCADNFDQALRILKHKHRSRLDRILISLDNS